MRSLSHPTRAKFISCIFALFCLCDSEQISTKWNYYAYQTSSFTRSLLHLTVHRYDSTILTRPARIRVFASIQITSIRI
ncbi:hypothetical protein BKA69DRAFT_1065021 [Paraphysoderma sedebokerense]|nr:hypothetical protein BKA69DRAFT_1065021 [Paraphysoderma sedebokerense]